MSHKDHNENALNRRIGYLLAVVAVLIIIALGIIFKRPSNKELHAFTSKDNQKEKNLTSADYLKRAKQALAEKSKEYPFGKLDEATLSLNQIKKGDKEYPKSQKMIKQIERWNRELKTIAKKNYEETQKKARRISYASDLANVFSREAYDITVGAEGKDATILKIKWTTTSRLLVRKLSNDPSLIEAWREMGFKKVVFTDGYRSTSYIYLR